MLESACIIICVDAKDLATNFSMEGIYVWASGLRKFVGKSFTKLLLQVWEKSSTNPSHHQNFPAPMAPATLHDPVCNTFVDQSSQVEKLLNMSHAKHVFLKNR